MERVALTLAVLIGLPVPVGGAAPLPRDAWALAVAPTPVESPTAPEVVPVQRPTVVEPPVATDGPATTEPVPTEPTGVEAPLDDEPPTTVEPGPEPAPTRPVATPWPEPPPGPQEPPPPPGTGMRVGGGILIGLGVLDVISGALGRIATNTADDEGLLSPEAKQLVRRISTVELTLGIMELGAGIGLVVVGELRAKRLRAWQASYHIDAPKTGNGMIVGGSTLLGLGVFDAITTAVIAKRTGETPVLDIVVVVAELATGAALLGVGATRKKRYRSWERSTFSTPSLSLLPGGIAMGVRGRF